METNPWRDVRLDVYESHMSHAEVGQLERLREIMTEQIADNPARTIGVLGVAGGNGLDVIDPASVDTVWGYDVNADYLEACRARFGERFGERLVLTECSVDRAFVIPPTRLLIANLIVEYIGVAEFAAFAALNASSIGVLSCATQTNEGVGIVSATEHAAAFDGIESIATEVDPEELANALSESGFVATLVREYSLPNGKALVRQDFTAAT